METSLYLPRRSEAGIWLNAKAFAELKVPGIPSEPHAMAKEFARLRRACPLRQDGVEEPAWRLNSERRLELHSSILPWGADRELYFRNWLKEAYPEDPDADPRWYCFFNLPAKHREAAEYRLRVILEVKVWVLRGCCWKDAYSIAACRNGISESTVRRWARSIRWWPLKVWLFRLVSQNSPLEFHDPKAMDHAARALLSLDEHDRKMVMGLLLLRGVSS